MTTQAPGPVTLRSAWEQLFRIWPGRDAPRSAWLAFHRREAELFGLAAQHDTDHQHEARFWASEAARVLRELEARDE
jgi:hypothetical protein